MNISPYNHFSRKFSEIQRFFLIVNLLFLFTAIVPLITLAQETQQPADSIKKVITAIPLIDIPEKAVEITSKIQTDLTLNLQKPVVHETHTTFDSIQNHVNQLQQLSDQLLEEQLPYSFYQSLLVRWSILESEIELPENILKDYSSDLVKIENAFNEDKEQWSTTYIEISNDDSPQEIVIRVKDVIQQIDSANQLLRDSIDLALTWLNNAAQIKMTIGNYQASIEAARKVQISQFLNTRTDPVWSADFSRDTVVLFGLNRNLVDFGIEDSRTYLATNKNTYYALGITFVLILIIIYWLRKQHETLSKQTKLKHRAGSFIVSRPTISALMLTALWSMWTLPEMPYLMDKLHSIIFLIPFLFIFHGIVGRPLRWSLYYLAVLFLYINFNSFFYIGMGANRWAFIIESFFIAGFLFWFLKKREKIRPDNHASRVWYQFLIFVSPIFLTVIIAGTVANLIGFVNINRLVASGTLTSLLLGLIFGTAFLAIRELLFLFSVTKVASLSNIIKRKSEELFNIFDRLAWSATVIIWLYFSLKSFMLWNPLMDWATKIWNIGYVFGALQVTFGGIISFFTIIVLSWLISRLIKLLLKEEVLVRFKLPRGVPMAISSLTQYTLVFLGFMLALAHAGFDLSNLGLLAGALGIGIGFGLQNLVGNFISGLILVFERPVTIGDEVRVDEYDGIVIKIGIRSSIIKQWDGSKVIVPNSDLISRKVLNWTMDKYARRFIVTISTPPDTDPDQVMKLMSEAVENIEGVLKEPAPKTYFKGVVDQALDFKLYYWVSENILDVESEANLAVQRKLTEAGVKILLPRKVEIQEKENLSKGK